jgi:hypothetical protein
MTPLPLPVGRGRTDRRRRLKKLEREVAEGRYHVPAETVADAILAAWRGETGFLRGRSPGKG